MSFSEKADTTQIEKSLATPCLPIALPDHATPDLTNLHPTP
jgi:hypothetical protein